MSDFGQSGSKRAPRGRPKKKPGYDREKEIDDLVQTAVTLFAVPFDDRDDRPDDAPSINSVAGIMKTSRVRVRKLLITADYYSSAASRRVQALFAQGRTIEQICEETGLKRQTVNSLLPYRKGCYNLTDPPQYAENCRVFRKRKRVCEQLSMHLDETGCYRHLWEAIKAFENYPFRTESEERLQYTVNCDRICFGSRTFCKEEIEAAFHKVRDKQKAEGCVKRENSPCCKELYAVFLRFGVCNL